MYAALITGGIALLQSLITNIPKWIETAKRNRELSAAAAAAKQSEYEAIWKKASHQVQPDPVRSKK